METGQGLKAAILKNTPFGFIFELSGESCYFSPAPYKIWLNGEEYREAHENVVCIYGLKPGTLYNVRAEGSFGVICFDIRTEKAEYIINAKDYNAIGDGSTDDTSAINAAIYTAPAGSVVYIPSGRYLVSHIFLKSGVDIYLAKGAVLAQNTTRSSLAIIKGLQRNYDHTDFTVNASWEGNPLDSYGSLIYGRCVSGIHIYGEGTLDGNGDISGFWKSPKEKEAAFRPRNIFLAECSDITISGLTSRNSAAWNVHPFYCSYINFYSLRLESDVVSPNTDGLNPESCDHVNIIGCVFNVGDDCIAIKSGKYFMANRRLKPSSDIVVRNCLMRGGHGGVVLGSEISGGVKNVLVEKCRFEGTDRGLRIKTRRGRGASSVVDGVVFSNVAMEGVRHCFTVNMFYNCDPDGKSDYVKNKNVREPDGETPTVRNISVSAIDCSGITGSAVFIYGLPENKVENITIQRSRFGFAQQRVNECPDMMDDFKVIDNLGVFIENTVNVSIKDTVFEGEHVNHMLSVSAGGDLS